MRVYGSVLVFALLSVFACLVHGVPEEHAFETEVQKVMNIIVRSLYKTTEIFLRELISNGADAIEKIRVLGLTDKKVIKLSAESNFNVSVSAFPEEKKLVIHDNGIGMTKEELKTNLGTIAKSGTADFIAKQIANKDASSLIGQFGVGFYSVFLVARRVDVHTRHPNGVQYKWSSTADSKFTIEQEDNPEVALEHGTRIVLHLKDKHVSEYTREDRLRNIILRHSSFVPVPIYLNATKTIEVDAPPESAGESKDKKEDTSDDEDPEKEDPEDSTDEEDDKKKKESGEPKKIKKTVYDMEHVNIQKPIWLRDPTEVNQTEHNAFFKATFKEYSDPLKHVHFKGEGDFSFHGLFYIPTRPQHSVLHVTPDKYVRNIKLYVRRVLITDELLEFLPRFLSFIRGIIDSDDFPLNVSRETVQKNKNLPKIKETMINKVLSAIESIAKNATEYKKFYDEYNGHLKIGVMETDGKRKIRLAKLLRFHSTFNTTKGADMTSLDEYISRMRKKQKSVYFLTGDSIKTMRKSPYVETLVKRGYEVLFMDDGIDEYLVNRFREYGKFKMQNIAQGSIDFGDESESEKEAFNKLAESYEPLTNWLTKLLNSSVESTSISKRLTTFACALIAPEHGWTGRMQSIMAAQKGDYMSSFYLGQKKKFEINPNHPIMISLLAKVEAEAIDQDVEDLARSLYDMAMIAGNYPLPDVSSVIKRIENAVRLGLGVDLSSEAKFYVKPAPEVDSSLKAPTEEDEGDDGSSAEAADEGGHVDLEDDMKAAENEEAESVTGGDPEEAEKTDEPKEKQEEEEEQLEREEL